MRKGKLLLILALSISCGEKSFVKHPTATKSNLRGIESYFGLESVGTCATSDRKHRVLTFSGLITQPEAGEQFVADLTFLLRMDSLSYRLKYREFPFADNTDTTAYENDIEGDFIVADNKIHLANLGVISMSVNGTKVIPILSLTTAPHRVLENTSSLGFVKYSNDSVVLNECD